MKKTIDAISIWRERVNQGQRLLFVRLLASMDQLADNPEDAQPEEYSHKRWQVGNGLEGWHRDQQGNPQIENQIALEQIGRA